MGLLLFLSSGPAAVAVVPLLLDADAADVSLAGSWSWLDDPEHLLAPEDALAALEDGRFQRLDGSLNRGYTHAASWLHVRLLNASGESLVRYLLLEPAYLDEVDVYVVDDGVLIPHRFGDHRSVAERDLPQSRMVLPIQLAADDSVDLLFRVRTLSTHLFLASLLDEPALQEALQWWLLLHGGFVAVALALFLTHLLLAYRLRDRVLIVYAFYVLTLGIGYAAMKGIVALMLPSLAHHVSDWLVSFGTGFSFALIALLVMTVFETRTRHRWSHAFLILVIVLGLGAFATTGQSLYPVLAEWLFLAGLPFLCLALTLAWVRYRAGDPAGKLFLLAFSASGLGASVTFLRILGFLPVTPLTEHSLQVSSFVHMIVMGLALSERVLAAEERARSVLRNAEGRAMELARRMTSELERNKQRLEDTLSRERQLRREQGDFIDTISHEYRTPLSVLMTNLDILRMRDAIDGQRFAIMSKALQRLAQIFNDAMRTHRLGHPPRALAEPVDLVALLPKLVADFREAHPDCPVHCDLDEQAPPAMVDRRMIELVLVNLLDNACKHRAIGERDTGVDIQLIPLDAELLIRVGNAVDGTALDRSTLMDRYVRGSRDRGSPGLGLGLYLVRRSVLDMGGSVEIVEAGPDRFIITLQLPQMDAE